MPAFYLGSNKLASLEDNNSGTPMTYKRSLSISSGKSVSDPVFMPTTLRSAVCGLAFLDDTSSGYFEYTLSPPDDVISEEAIWRMWPEGEVNYDTDNMLTGPVTALRAVCTAGSLTFEITGS